MDPGGRTDVAKEVTWLYRWLITFCATAATESGELLLPTERGTRALLGMDDIEEVPVDEDDEDEFMEDIWDMTTSMGSIEMPRVAVTGEDPDPAPSMAMSFAFPVEPVFDGLAALSLKIALALSFDSIPSNCHVLLGHSKWTVAAYPGWKGMVPSKKTTMWLMFSASSSWKVNLLISTCCRFVCTRRPATMHPNMIEERNVDEKSGLCAWGG